MRGDGFARGISSNLARCRPGLRDGGYLAPVPDHFDVLLGQAEFAAQVTADGRDGQGLACAPRVGSPDRENQVLHGLIHEGGAPRRGAAADQPIDLDVCGGGDLLDVLGGRDLDDDVSACADRCSLEPAANCGQGGLIGHEQVEVDAFADAGAGLRARELQRVADRGAEGPLSGKARVVTDDVDGKRIRICIDTADRVIAGETESFSVPIEPEIPLLTDVEGFGLGSRYDELHVIVETLGVELRPRHPVHHTCRQLVARYCQAPHVRRDIRDAGDFHLTQDDRQHLHGPGSTRHEFGSEGLLTDETSRPGVRSFKQVSTAFMHTDAP